MGQICTDSSRSNVCLIGAAMLTLMMETMETVQWRKISIIGVDHQF